MRTHLKSNETDKDAFNEDFVSTRVPGLQIHPLHLCHVVCGGEVCGGGWVGDFVGLWVGRWVGGLVGE